MTTFELLGRTIASASTNVLQGDCDVGCGRVHRLPTLDDLGHSKALEEPAVPLSRDHRHHARPALVARHRVQQSLLPSNRLMVHVGDLDAFERSNSTPDTESRARVIRMHVHLERALVADHEQGVAEGVQLAFELVRVEPISLDYEDRAVPIARQLLMNGLQTELRRWSGSGSGSPET